MNYASLSSHSCFCNLHASFNFLNLFVNPLATRCMPHSSWTSYILSAWAASLKIRFDIELVRCRFGCWASWILSYKNNYFVRLRMIQIKPCMKIASTMFSFELFNDLSCKFQLSVIKARRVAFLSMTILEFVVPFP